MPYIYRIANAAYRDKVPEVPGYGNVILSDSKEFGIDCSAIVERLPNSSVAWHKIAWLKLFIPWVAHEDRVVYMDCDTHVLGDISLLWNMRLKGPCAMRIIEAALPSELNSGVIVFDCAKWRECFDIDMIMELCCLTLTNHIRGKFTGDEHVFEMLNLKHEFDNLDARFNETGSAKPETKVKHDLWTIRKYFQCDYGLKETV
jgi:lipopolysaccharide biosynthesis glycosyltransferase